MTNLFNLKPVLTSEKFIDAVLNRVTTGTNNTVHARFKITKVRKFYIAKVTRCKEEYTNRLKQIVDTFPRVSDLDPFTSAFLAILYDYDSYKVALSKLSYAKNSIEKVASDNIKLIKYADSAYACKRLKIASFGHMSKVISKLKKYLSYLESVRQHLNRLPVISVNKSIPSGASPIFHTFVLCGYPNAGKSSLLNKLTGARSGVEEYAFSTRTIFRGMLNHGSVSAQFLDTPGLLDRPLETRNAAEMVSLIALGKLDCSVVFCLDPTEDLEEQVRLFVSLRPLLKGEGKGQKKAWVVFTKTDQIRKEHSDSSKFEEKLLGMKRRFFETLNALGEEKIEIEEVLFSDLSDETNGNIKNALLGNPESPSENASVFFPSEEKKRELLSNLRQALSINKEKSMEEQTKKLLFTCTEEMKKALGSLRENDNGLEIDLRAFHQLGNPEEIYDIQPEIYLGENVKDHIHPNSKERLEILEAEEEKLEEEFVELRDKLSKEIYDKEYFELRDKEKKHINTVLLLRCKRLVEKSRKGSAMPKSIIKKAQERRNRRTGKGKGNKEENMKRVKKMKENGKRKSSKKAKESKGKSNK